MKNLSILTHGGVMRNVSHVTIEMDGGLKSLFAVNPYCRVGLEICRLRSWIEK